MSDLRFSEAKRFEELLTLSRLTSGPCQVLTPWTGALAPSHAMCGVDVFDPGASIPL